MQLIELGKSGLKVSKVCLGTWQLSPRFWGQIEQQPIIDAITQAFDAGINFYDTAGAYGDGLSETVVGKAIAKLPREKIVVATKVFWHFHPDGKRYPDLSAEYIVEYVEDSLKRMNTDYIDLLQCHSYDYMTPVEEIIEGLEKVLKQGKVRAYGTSNWTVEQIRKGLNAGGKFYTCQPLFSLLHDSAKQDMLPFCRANGIGTLVYSPLARGVLSGKYKGDEKFDDSRQNSPDYQGQRFKTICDAMKKVEQIGQNYNLSPVQTILAATFMHTDLDCLIVGTKKPQHILDAADTPNRKLTREHFFQIQNLFAI